MSRDFEPWNNAPVHYTPPDVDRVLRSEDRRRERRRHLLMIIGVLLGVVVSLLCALRFG
jgi:hypothetical protein